ncbi:hypothetical protein [Streptomyces sp. NPDC002685]|uniref:hypothetical protein n=1 Tax=Streptomyces sp. NPDC002685 TaxID=3154540 RepID=UPI0033339748
MAVRGVFFATTVVAPVVFAASAAPWAAEAAVFLAVLVLFLAVPAVFLAAAFLDTGFPATDAVFFAVAFLAAVFLAAAFEDAVFVDAGFVADAFEAAAPESVSFEASASAVTVFEGAAVRSAVLAATLPAALSAVLSGVLSAVLSTVLSTVLPDVLFAVFVGAAFPAGATVLEVVFTGFASSVAGAARTLLFPVTSLAAAFVDLPDADCCTAVFFATMAAAPSHIVILIANRAGTINRLLARGNGARPRFARPASPARQACMRCAQLPAR